MRNTMAVHMRYNNLGTFLSRPLQNNNVKLILRFVENEPLWRKPLGESNKYCIVLYCYLGVAYSVVVVGGRGVLLGHNNDSNNNNSINRKTTRKTTQTTITRYCKISQ